MAQKSGLIRQDFPPFLCLCGRFHHHGNRDAYGKLLIDVKHHTVFYNLQWFA
ncbi:MAG: hypothetical protein ACOC57_07630 [Acidobacteriota bacterium]